MKNRLNRGLAAGRRAGAGSVPGHVPANRPNRRPPPRCPHGLGLPRDHPRAHARRDGVLGRRAVLPQVADPTQRRDRPLPPLWMRTICVTPSARSSNVRRSWTRSSASGSCRRCRARASSSSTASSASGWRWPRWPTSLEREGKFTVFNVSYPSTRRGIDEHAKTLAGIVARLDGITEIDFVGFSMGNVVIRRYLSEQSDAAPATSSTRGSNAS